ncbi:uncharacterized protein LOC127750959 [Frankliniella occidentalis]|uniref:Uncharacterized protein LOC127750959 n=1 Tax=Frankliniella occidentalis TaxID=133901 RepID=A0A9C6X5W8_FRAOC|nr:uncharacterized protein LOC127750959 [Frankliniella occidentalis]
MTTYCIISQSMLLKHTFVQNCKCGSVSKSAVVAPATNVFTGAVEDVNSDLNCNANSSDSTYDSQVPCPSEVSSVAGHHHNLNSTSLRDAADLFVSKLYGKPKLPRQYVQQLINDVTSLICDGLLSSLKSNIVSNLELNSDQLSVLDKQFKDVENPFSHLCSEYHRFKYYSASGDFIPPISYEIGELDVVKNSCLKTQKVYGQFVPLQSILKQFLEVPDALNDILVYLRSLETNPELKQNFVQCNLWKRKCEKFSDDDIVLPLHAYYDECQCNNPLGAHACKLGCAYVQIGCLPPECQTSAENIFLALLFNSDYRCFSDKKVFGPLIEQLKFLEEHGIEVKTPDGIKRVYFICSLLLGDNLGVNSVGGFAESFSANYFCRFCKTHKDDTASQTIENPHLLRSKESYNADLATDDVTLTGVKSDCVFNQIPSFHITSNFSVDSFHDLGEGVAHYVMMDVLKRCVPQLFTVELLNHRIEMFEYGTCDSNRIPVLSLEFAKKKKLKMSGSETYMFVKMFGLLIGDKVPHDDPHWCLYLKLRKLMDICMSKAFNSSEVIALRVSVQEFNDLYMSVTGHGLRPKFHNLVHYPRILEESGPVALISTAKFESKHRKILAPARATESRRNICLTIAVQHQLNMFHAFKSKTSILPEIEYGPLFEINLSDFSNPEFARHLPRDLNLTFTSSCLASNWVEFKGTKYQPGMVLVVNVDESGGPVFGKLESILHSPIPVFVYSSVLCLGLDDHVDAYEVDFSDTLSSTSPLTLHDPLPLSVHRSILGKKFKTFPVKISVIVCKHDYSNVINIDMFYYLMNYYK